MRRYNGQSNGKAQAMSTCFRVAGLIRTVKAVKQMLQCLPGNVLNRIVYAELYAVALFRQSQMDLTVRSTVFNGIVQQDGNQLPEAFSSPHMVIIGSMETSSCFSLVLASAWKVSAVSAATSERGNSIIRA